MNQVRRKSISRILVKLSEISGEMESILSDIEQIKTEEEESFENIPENLQESDRYQAAETAVDHLNDAYDLWQEAFESIEDVASSLEEAME